VLCCDGGSYVSWLLLFVTDRSQQRITIVCQLSVAVYCTVLLHQGAGSWSQPLLCRWSGREEGVCCWVVSIATADHELPVSVDLYHDPIL
jgi:hypothetical protein